MSIETQMDETINDLIASLTEEFGVELTTEDHKDVVANTKTKVSKINASRTKNTKSR